MIAAYRDALEGAPKAVCPRRTAPALNRLETSNWDFVAALYRWRGKPPLEKLREQLREMTGASAIFFAPSGRSAFAQLLLALPQEEVVMPAWTCRALKRAAELAGKRIVYVDIDRVSLNATADQYAPAAKSGRILVPTHLFGIPTDIEKICALAKERRCITIEDAAAAFPAELNGRLLGTLGDCGFISFERSKRIPAFRGGAIFVNNQRVFDEKSLRSNRLTPRSAALPFQEVMRGGAYNVATIPWLYGRLVLPKILREYTTRTPPTVSLPPTTDPFYSREFHPYQASLVLRLLQRRNKIHEHIRRLTAIYLDVFRHTGIQTFISAAFDSGCLLRFPIALPGRTRRDILRAALKRSLYLETNYEHPLPEEPDVHSFPVSAWAANNIVLLPLYSALSEQTAKRLAYQIVDIEREIKPATTVSPARGSGAPASDHRTRTLAPIL